jgi:prevent-host-death family protein
VTIRNVADAKAELSALLVMVEKGEDVVIARAGKPIARLVPITHRTEPRRPGALKGKIWISPDFDAPDQEIQRLFEEGSVEPAS